MMHYSVLLKESIDGLNIKKDGIYVDATMGYGGHTKAILDLLDGGKLYAFDQDIEAINYVKQNINDNNLNIIYSNFVDMKQKLKEFGIDKVDGIIFDLGVSSPQIDNASRGFSFMNDSILDMRMDLNSNFSALDVVNDYSFEKLIDVFYKYGEESMSKKIAKYIVDNRKLGEIKTTKQLVDIVYKAVGANYFNKFHPERKIFQAIRIEVNKELMVLEQVLPDAIDLLNKGGRISVITFHSLEDRIVKQLFKKESEVNEFYRGMPEIPEKYMPRIRLVNKKPIVAPDVELKENSRSKSAKLRIIERI